MKLDGSYFNSGRYYDTHIWQCGIFFPTASDVPWDFPSSANQRYIQAMVMIQRFSDFICGNDNDGLIDGSAMNWVGQTNSTILSSGALNGKANLQPTTQSDVDLSDNAGNPAEYYRLIIGSDSTNMYFVIVAPMYPASGSTTPAGIINGFCIKFINTSGNWDSFGSTSLPGIYSNTSWISNGTTGVTGTQVTAGSALAMMIPCRLPLK